MGFFKKDRKGGKCGHYKSGGGIKGMEKAMGGYTLYSHEKESGAKTEPITKKAGNNLKQ